MGKKGMVKPERKSPEAGYRQKVKSISFTQSNEK